jgi:predicted HAD superfamily Cof-like phosphohydrolase
MLTPPEMVREFHEVFGHPTEDKPTLNTKANQKLRCQLIREELYELEEACMNEDIVGIGDALGDILWVTLGGFEVFGMAGDIGNQIMQTIYKSNMSKLCKTVDEAKKFIDETAEEDGPKYGYEEIDTGKVALYWLYGEKAGKIAKGPHYKEPDLSFIKEAQ